MSNELPDKKSPLERVRHYVEMRESKPLAHYGDQVHGIHAGTEWEAMLLLSDLKALVSTGDARKCRYPACEAGGFQCAHDCDRSTGEFRAQPSATQPPEWRPTEATSLFQRLQDRGLVLPIGILERLRYISSPSHVTDGTASRNVTEDARFLVALLEEMLPPAVPVGFSDGGGA